MNGFAAFLAWPVGMRLALMGLVGVVVGAAVNWVVRTLEREYRRDEPSSRKGAVASRAGLVDRLPLVGWWRTAGRGSSDVAGAWLRPFIVELVCGLGFAAWYWWEAVAGGLLNPHIAPGLIANNVALAATLHADCFVHLVLAALMLAAALIDADEWIIPDELTVPGTVAGLVLLTLFPAALLPAFFDRRFMTVPLPLDAGMPFPWPATFAAGATSALLIGVGCLLFWLVGLMVGGRWPGVRSGARRYHIAIGLFLRRIRSDRWSLWMPLFAMAGSAAIAGVWHWAPARWPALLSSLLGLAGGAAIVWVVRILGTWAFQKEAMGFGDVTLLAMIGAYIGWQPVLLVFFAAPIAALCIYLPAFLLWKRKELPYGPYLCASAVGVIWFWGEIWIRAEDYFNVAWLVPTVLVGGFFILGCSLSAYRTLNRIMHKQ